MIYQNVLFVGHNFYYINADIFFPIHTVMKTVSDCLNFIDSMFLYNIEKRDGIEKLENMRDYFLDCYNGKNNEELLAILPILYQIILKIDRFYIHNDYNFTDFIGNWEVVYIVGWKIVL